MVNNLKSVLVLLVIVLCLHAPITSAQEVVFDDATLSQEIVLPEWFKLSFLDIKDDLIDAADAKKKGIILYFGRKDCPYCKALIENNWGKKEIAHYTRQHFDVIAINTKGTKSVTDIDGFVYDEKNYALKHKTNFTPSLLFYDTNEKLILKLSGYQQPYRFMAALEYVADKHYETLSLGDYLLQAKDSLASNGNDELNHQPYFDPPPHNLNRQHFSAERPLAVFFERKNCHACDILHSSPLENPGVQKQLSDLDVIQLDVDDNHSIITPAGSKTNINNWGRELDLHYSPTIIFFDEKGKEIIRIDSVVWVNRLGRVLDYISSKAYQRFSSFHEWRISKSKK